MVVSLAKTVVVGEPAPAYRPGKGGYADRAILAVQGFKESLDHDYRTLMDVLREMPRLENAPVEKLTQTELAEWHDIRRRTIYSWLIRLDTDEPLEQAVSDARRSGRSRRSIPLLTNLASKVSNYF
jgi:hypothetical protein